MCAHSYRLVMRGSVYGSTASTPTRGNFYRSRERAGRGRRKDVAPDGERNGERTRGHWDARGRAMARVSLMAKRRYTMAGVSNHIKQ